MLVILYIRMDQPQTKRQKILRNDEIMRLLLESEGESDEETTVISESEEAGWVDSDVEIDGDANSQNDVEGDDEAVEEDERCPLVQRKNTRELYAHRLINSFQTCLDESNYDNIAPPGQHIEYKVKVNKGQYQNHIGSKYMLVLL